MGDSSLKGVNTTITQQIDVMPTIEEGQVDDEVKVSTKE